MAAAPKVVRINPTPLPAGFVDSEPKIDCGFVNPNVSDLSSASLAPYVAITNELTQGINEARQAWIGTPTKIFRALEKIEQPAQFELLRLAYCRSQQENLDSALDSVLTTPELRLRAQNLKDDKRPTADAHGLAHELNKTWPLRNDDEIRYILEHTPLPQKIDKIFSGLPNYGDLREKLSQVGGVAAERNIALLEGDLVRATMISLDQDDPTTLGNWIKERLNPAQLAEVSRCYQAEKGKTVEATLAERFDSETAAPLMALIDGNRKYAEKLELALAVDPAEPRGLSKLVRTTVNTLGDFGLDGAFSKKADPSGRQ